MNTTKKCKDCDYCKISLPIEKGRLLYSAPEGLKLQCVKNAWRNDDKTEKILFPASLTKANNLLESNRYTSKHWQCAENILDTQ
jgi:hypothetical protein